MTFTVVDVAQRSPEWMTAHCGRVTGSVAKDMMATLKTGAEPACRRDLRMRLALERLTGVPQFDDGYVNADMRRGTELEPEAFAEYEASTGIVLHQSGFLACSDIQAGVSLDGHTSDFSGIVELKVPKSATHYGYLKARELPAEHRWQVLHGLYVTGAQWADFVSWDPRFPPALRFVRVRVARDTVDLVAYELSLRLFLDEVQREYEDIERMSERVVA